MSGLQTSCIRSGWLGQSLRRPGAAAVRKTGAFCPSHPLRGRPEGKPLMTAAAALAVTFALGLAGAPAQPPAVKDAPVKERTASPRKGVVPFELLATNHMVVQARRNGKGPYRLIFDLGAPITLLSNRASEASGVVKKTAPKSVLFALRGEAVVDRLELGGLTVRKLPAIVLDHPAVRVLGEVLGKPLDGIIGYTFFARYKTTIDYQKREMTFEPVDFGYAATRSTTKTSRPGEVISIPSASAASRIRSTPAAKPIPGVSGPPSAAASPS